MQHLKWTKTGRVSDLSDEGKPNKRIWQSSSGQRNVDLGGGNFAPYTWDSDRKIASFGEGELRFTATGLEYWYKGSMSGSFSLHPEIKTLDWERKTVTVNGLTVKEIDNGDSKARIEISYKISTSDADALVTVLVGYNHKVTVGVDIEAKLESEQQIKIESDRVFTPVKRVDIEGQPLDPIWMKSGNFLWKWAEGEIDDHIIEHDAIKSSVAIARKIYDVGEIVSIRPDTWGQTGIAADADDGHQVSGGAWALDGTGSGHIYVSDGYSPGTYGMGFSWEFPNIPAGSTIDKCYIRAKCRNTGSAAAGLEISYGIQDVDPASQVIWSATNLPYSASFTRANSDNMSAWSNYSYFFGESDIDPLDMTNDLQDIVDDYGEIEANDRVNFAILGGDDNTDRMSFEDYSDAGTGEPECYVEWTEGASGISIPVAMHHYTKNITGR